MRYYQLGEWNSPRLAVATAGSVYDLTTATTQLQTFEELLRASVIANQSIDSVTDRLLEDATVLPSVHSTTLRWQRP